MLFHVPPCVCTIYRKVFLKRKHLCWYFWFVFAWIWKILRRTSSRECNRNPFNPLRRWEGSAFSFIQYPHKANTAILSAWCLQHFYKPDGTAVPAEPWLSKRLEIHLWGDSVCIDGNWFGLVHSQGLLSEEYIAQLERWSRKMSLHCPTGSILFFAVCPLYCVVRGKEMHCPSVGHTTFYCSIQRKCVCQALMCVLCRRAAVNRPLSNVWRIFSCSDIWASFSVREIHSFLHFIPASMIYSLN